MGEVTPAGLYEFIAKHELAVVSTVNTHNLPQSALVGIAVTPQLELVFDTVKTSRKYANLISNPACSVVIGWTGEQTLQYEGMAQELAGTELGRYQQFYFATWPDAPQRQSWPGLVYFVIKPKWIRYSDFDQNPRFIREFTF